MAKKSADPIDKYVGNRVRMRRRELGMSQTKLADNIGLTFQQIQKYEKGANRMGASRLQQIASALQVHVTYFFEDAANLSPLINGTSALHSTAYVSEFLSINDGMALAKAFMQIKEPKLRRRIVSLVEQMAGSHEG
jgi:transcriptional regulator with XRE-family HTH domain